MSPAVRDRSKNDLFPIWNRKFFDSGARKLTAIMTAGDIFVRGAISDRAGFTQDGYFIAPAPIAFQILEGKSFMEGE